MARVRTWMEADMLSSLSFRITAVSYTHLSRGEEVLDLRARNLIIAVGAMERPVPFRGWTLPGVMNAGAGDILLKTAGLLPETPVVLAGKMCIRDRTGAASPIQKGCA